MRIAIGRWFLRFLGLQKIKHIAIKRSVLDDLCLMARDAHPKEMLAFLSAPGGIKQGLLLINEIQLQAYDSSTDAATVPLAHLPTHTSIIGTAHSHPGSSARPSDADVHLFSQYGLVHAIIPEPYVVERIKFYDKQGRQIVVTIL